MTWWQAFVRQTCENGQDILRIFDALNDVRNLATSIKTTKQCGKHARGELCYTISPVHTVENFVKMGVELEKMGCDSLGIKDMSGILQPQIAYRLVKELKSKVGIPITLAHARHGGLGRGQLSCRHRCRRGLRRGFDRAVRQRHLPAGHAAHAGAAGRPSALPEVRHAKTGEAARLF